MPAISLKAHYDGQAIRLDEPYDLPQDAQLLVTVLSTAADDGRPTGWPEFSAAGLSRAYGEQEPEYSAADILP